MSKQKLPIIVGEELKPAPLGIQLYICVFRWDNMTLLNLENQQKVTGKIWIHVCNNPCFAFKYGRKVYGKPKTYKIRTVDGEIVTRTSRESKDKVYGYEGLSVALSGRFPITADEVQKLVEPAIQNNASHMKFVLKSDLVPTSPNRYTGKNEWVLISDYPSTDKINRKLNLKLKAAGSPLRIEAGLRHKMVEV